MSKVTSLDDRRHAQPAAYCVLAGDGFVLIRFKDGNRLVLTPGLARGLAQQLNTLADSVEREAKRDV
jgi:hypothetical protein